MKADFKPLDKMMVSLQNIDAQQILKRKDIVVYIVIIICVIFLVRTINQKQAVHIMVLEKSIEEAGTIIDLQKKVDGVRKEIQKYRNELPMAREFTDVINEVSRMARKNKIEIANFTQQQVRNSDYSYQLPLSLSVNGDYYDIWSFLRDLENSQELFTFENISITKANDPRKSADEDSGYCSASIAFFATSIKKD